MEGGILNSGVRDVLSVQGTFEQRAGFCQLCQ